MPYSNPFSVFAHVSKDLFFSYDLQSGNFVYINPAFQSFFGLNPIKIDKDQILETVHLDDRSYLLSKLEECINSEQVADLECRITPHKAQLWIRIKAYRISQEGKNLIIGQAEDISVYKENMENLHNHNIKKTLSSQ